MSSRSSTRTEGLPERVVVATVRRAHGIHGEVLIEPLSDVPARFAPGSELELAGAGEPRSARIESCRPHADGLLLKLAGCEDRDAAEALRGAALAVPRQAAPAAPAGSYYHFQLLGCRCHDARAGELGLVVGLVEDGGGTILEIEGPAGRLLVPFAAAYLAAVDVEARRIELELPAGLVDTCTSRS